MRCEDLTGRRFGRWHVIERAENRPDRTGRSNARWKCRCECEFGTIRTITGWALRAGNTTKCGRCGRRNGSSLSAREIVKDQRYGWLTTKQYLGGRRTNWECVCDCGRTLVVTGYHLVSGHSTKCRSCSVKTRYKAAGYHSLTDINKKTMTAKCCICGLVPIRCDGRSPRCYVATVVGARVSRPDEALEMFELQHGECANPSCHNPLVFNQGTGKSACLDHDHVTGFIRRWFCSGCNTAFGYARESSVVLRGLAKLASEQEKEPRPAEHFWRPEHLRPYHVSAIAYPMAAAA
jgi:hypothetical protein